jgi:PAS domain S-box-containing protein
MILTLRINSVERSKLTRPDKPRLVGLGSAHYNFGITATSMTPAQLQNDLFSRLAEPFTCEALFDCLPDLVFFIKNHRSEYVVVNQTLVERCGRKAKTELIGRRANELFPPPLGESYRSQDEAVLRSGTAVRNQLELHFYATGGRGWCLTNKLPLRDKRNQVVGIVGISKDLRAANEKGEDYSEVARVVHFIQKNPGENLRVPELAAQAGLSAYQFEQRIRKLFYLTAGQLIQKTRMEAAAHRLRETNDPISAIALDCGYSDQSAFTRQFRQTIGLSPSEYRAACGGRI